MSRRKTVYGVTATYKRGIKRPLSHWTYSTKRERDAKYKKLKADTKISKVSRWTDSIMI